MNEMNPAEPWTVVAATLHDRGDATNGTQETVVAEGSEEEARRVFADTKAQANELGYDSVTLRRHGHNVEWWPEETGWTV
jgi:hypothetical protein